MHSTDRLTRLLTSLSTGKHLARTARLLTLALFTPISLAAQAASVLTGRVIDRESGQPLAGAHVSIIGTTQGVVTRSDGSFRLPVPAGSHVILISYVGYTPQRDTVSIAAEQNVSRNYTLDRGVTQLNSAVIIGTRAHDRTVLNPGAGRRSHSD